MVRKSTIKMFERISDEDPTCETESQTAEAVLLPVVAEPLLDMLELVLDEPTFKKVRSKLLTVVHKASCQLDVKKETD